MTVTPLRVALRVAIVDDEAPANLCLGRLAVERRGARAFRGRGRRAHRGRREAKSRGGGADRERHVRLQPFEHDGIRRADAWRGAHGVTVAGEPVVQRAEAARRGARLACEQRAPCGRPLVPSRGAIGLYRRGARGGIGGRGGFLDPSIPPGGPPLLEGPNFFEQRDMDVPQLTELYDPQLDDTPRVQFIHPTSHAQLGGAQEEQQAEKPAEEKKEGR